METSDGGMLLHLAAYIKGLSPLDEIEGITGAESEMCDVTWLQTFEKNPTGPDQSALLTVDSSFFQSPGWNGVRDGLRVEIPASFN